jgi:hypothetical protein
VRWLRVVLLLVLAASARAELTLPDYRYFRALSIDLQGRPPTPAELTAFEQDGFDLGAWIDSRLASATYAERLERVYMDLLRLDVGPSFQFVPPALVLRREQVMGPNGMPLYIYFRRGQRRVDPATDGDFCLTFDDTGLSFPPNADAVGTPRPVPQNVLDAKTVVVRPWWLFADYRAALPVDRIAPEWKQRFPGFEPAPGLLEDGSVRVCREEAQTIETGTVYVSGRPNFKRGDPLPAARLTPPPNDTAFAKQHRGRAVSCLTATGAQNAVDCGCGIGLERCLPGAGAQFDPPGFIMPTHLPLGPDLPFEGQPKGVSEWPKLWWSEEARRFLDRIFVEDRDFREVLTSRATEVNGPLAQFYRFMASATCCGPEVDPTGAEPLTDPGAMPSALVPEDTATWMPVADRGPHASGIFTMPIFLTKYGSRRARAHVAYSAFLCKDFIADTAKLAPSTEEDLTKRPGCSTCHQTLEPLAAYFTRVAESDWTWLPATTFPLNEPRCDKDRPPGYCKPLYDPAFHMLRSAYAAPSHAEQGPAGLAHAITTAPEFAPCVVQNVAQSFLGRPLEPEDEPWKTRLVQVFVDGGYRMRPLVRAIVTSPRYKAGNDAR